MFGGIVRKLFGGANGDRNTVKKRLINEVDPGRYPVNCNPVPAIRRNKIIICGLPYGYNGNVKILGKTYVVLSYGNVYRHIIGYGPFLLVVDSNIDGDFLETYDLAAEAERVDNNIPFTVHEYPERYTQNSRVYYDGYFLYLNNTALYAPHLGSVKSFSENEMVFENGVFRGNRIEYRFDWSDEEVKDGWRIY